MTVRPLLGLGVAMALSALLRTGGLDAGYWIDEGIAVGIASHDLAEIPRVLRQDGSPPLYYLLLHGWMALVGSGEAATRALSLAFALAAVPVAWWAGRAVFDRRAVVAAAAGAAACPFLTYYAQETRMYSLVVVLSLAACASFVLAFLRGRRGHVAALGAWLVLLLYTHTWGLFLAAGMAVAWVVLWRDGRVAGRDGAWLGAAVALLYAPWVPSLLFQAAHTGAPWSERPGPLHLLAVPGALFGYVAAPVLVAAAVAAWRRSPRAAEAAAESSRQSVRAVPAAEAVRVLALVALVAVLAAFAWSQVEPAWSSRYLAVVLGPLLLALAAVLSRRSAWTGAALIVVAAIWLGAPPPPAKSNVRAVAVGVAPDVRPGDLVVSTQPEQVPVLHRYLPRGVVYVTPLGVVADPGVTDWRDGLARLRTGRAERVLAPLVGRLEPGRRVLLVTPVPPRRRSHAPWSRAVRVRTREWRAALHGDPRLRSIVPAPRSALPRLRSAVRAEVFEVAPPASAGRSTSRRFATAGQEGGGR